MNIYDVVIIGSGPCGISAAIYLQRLNRKILLLGDSFGGQVSYSGIIENYLGFDSISGYDLSKKFIDNLKYNKINYIIEYVENIKLVNNNIVKIFLKSKNIYSKTLLIASGSKYKKLLLENENEYFNKGIYNCAICDGYLFHNKDVAIIGGGNTALDSALVLSKYCNKIYLINKNNIFKGENSLLDKVRNLSNVFFFYNSLTNKILVNDNKISGISFIYKKINIKKININGIFVNIGMKTNINFLKNLLNENQIKVNQFNEIIVNKFFQTNIKNIFAAGDVIEKDFKQAIISAGEGALSALYINKFLK